MNKETVIVALQQIKGIGISSINRLIDSNTCELDSGLASLIECYEVLKSINKKTIELGPDALKELYKASEQTLENQESIGIHTITKSSPEYPTALKAIKNPPPLIHYRGNISTLSENNVAVVGSRKMSPSTSFEVKGITQELVAKGFNTVSGLALGVDTLAHLATIDQKGKTIAVLAHGLELITPNSNRALANEILERQGCLISEYLIGTKLIAGNYLMRNRIQSAISKAVIICEAGIQSGTIETAHRAHEQGKHLACLPLTTDNSSNYTAFHHLVNNLNAVNLDSTDNRRRFYDQILTPPTTPSINTNEQLNLF